MCLLRYTSVASFIYVNLSYKYDPKVKEKGVGITEGCNVAMLCWIDAQILLRCTLHCQLSRRPAVSRSRRATRSFTSPHEFATPPKLLCFIVPCLLHWIEPPPCKEGLYLYYNFICLVKQRNGIDLGTCFILMFAWIVYFYSGWL